MIQFILGCMSGGIIGVVMMCIFNISSRESEKEERYNETHSSGT